MRYSARRFSLVLTACLAVGAIGAAQSDARTEFTFCKTGRGIYLLVSETSCHVGRVVTHSILRGGSDVKHLPALTHVGGWTCRITDPTGGVNEPAIRCRRRRGELIWSGRSFTASPGIK